MLTAVRLSGGYSLPWVALPRTRRWKDTALFSDMGGLGEHDICERCIVFEPATC